jgi:hypothetical protein
MQRRFTQPQAQTHEQAAPEGLPVQRGGPRPAETYIFVHYEQSWYHSMEVDPETKQRYGWLPRPKRAIGKPGVNGVKDPGYAKPVRIQHMRGMLNGHAEAGARVLYPNDSALGRYMHYNKFYTTTTGGEWYVEPGQEALVTPNGSIMWNSDDVQPALLAFHAFLRYTNLVHPFVREYFMQKMGVERNRLSRFEQAASANPSLNHKIDKQRAKIEAMQEDWAVYEREITRRMGLRSPQVQQVSHAGAAESQPQPQVPADNFDTFDTNPADLLDMALTSAVVVKAGAWLKFEGENLGRGRDAALEALSASPALQNRLHVALDKARSNS